MAESQTEKINNPEISEIKKFPTCAEQREIAMLEASAEGAQHTRKNKAPHRLVYDIQATDLSSQQATEAGFIDPDEVLIVKYALGKSPSSRLVGSNDTGQGPAMSGAAIGNFIDEKRAQLERCDNAAKSLDTIGYAMAPLNKDQKKELDLNPNDHIVVEVLKSAEAATQDSFIAEIALPDKKGPNGLIQMLDASEEMKALVLKVAQERIGNFMSPEWLKEQGYVGCRLAVQVGTAAHLHLHIQLVKEGEQLIDPLSQEMEVWQKSFERLSQNPENATGIIDNLNKFLEPVMGRANIVQSVSNTEITLDNGGTIAVDQLPDKGSIAEFIDTQSKAIPLLNTNDNGNVSVGV